MRLPIPNPNRNPKTHPNPIFNPNPNHKAVAIQLWLIHTPTHRTRDLGD